MRDCFVVVFGKFFVASIFKDLEVTLAVVVVAVFDVDDDDEDDVDDGSEMTLIDVKTGEDE